MKSMPRLLIIEDEIGIRLTLYRALNQVYKVNTAKTAVSGLNKAAAQHFDAILLDLGLPDMYGLTVCRQMRELGITAPIIILNGESSVKSKISLLDAGASDYVTKPFNINELQARLRACLRPSVKKPATQITVGTLTLDSHHYTVIREGTVIPLRRKEFTILEYLMQHAGKVVSRASLMDYAWGSQEDSWTNTIDVHIKHLRDKIDRPFEQAVIKTVHGLGYKLDVPNVVAKVL